MFTNSAPGACAIIGVMNKVTSVPSLARQVLTVETIVPYSLLISGWLQVSTCTFDTLIQRSRKYEQAYLAWETVRRIRNPMFVDGTGFEGYMVGLYDDPGVALEALLRIGHTILENNDRLYRFNRNFRTALMQTLHGESADVEAVAAWAAEFGATVGRLRSNLIENATARDFQAETYRSTSTLPKISYHYGPREIEQHYLLSAVPVARASGWSAGFDHLPPVDAEAGYVISTIGKFGHPLVRAFLDERLIACSY